MSKTLFNFCLDTTLLVQLLLLGWVSVVLQFVFPAGPRAFDYELWGWNYAAWRDFQFGILCVFALGILLHVMMHWTWCCGVVARQILKRKALPDGGLQTIYGVAFLIILFHILGIGFALAQFMIHDGARSPS